MVLLTDGSPTSASSIPNLLVLMGREIYVITAFGLIMAVARMAIFARSGRKATEKTPLLQRNRMDPASKLGKELTSLLSATG